MNEHLVVKGQARNTDEVNKIISMLQEDGRLPYDEMAAFGHPQREVSGSTLCIVGYGGIGRAIGCRAAALGMRVVAVRSRPGAAPAEGAHESVGPEGLSEALARSHYVVLSLPETPETTGLIDAATSSVTTARLRSSALMVSRMATATLGPTPDTPIRSRNRSRSLMEVNPNSAS